MPRRIRPATTQRSEHWLRKAVNNHHLALNQRIQAAFQFESADTIHWQSPVASDGYSEYFDEEFLTRLGLRDMEMPLREFWPRSGPRWDGLAKTDSGKVILVEAKAYIEESVDYKSEASPISLQQINTSLQRAKTAFNASAEANWEAPFYQYANRLAHLYYLRELNQKDAYLLFLCFADAPDIPQPCTVEQWQGASRLTKKCLGLGKHPFLPFVKTLIWSVSEMTNS